MHIYSGNVDQGKCGLATHLVDIDGAALYVGDVVMLWVDGAATGGRGAVCHGYSLS